MAKRKGQDNLRDILILANQTARTKTTINRQIHTLQYLQTHNGQATRQQLETELGIKYSHLNKKDPKQKKEYKTKEKKFYNNTLTPLIGTLIETDRQLNYYLSPITFKRWFNSLYRTGIALLTTKKQNEATK